VAGDDRQDKENDKDKPTPQILYRDRFVDCTSTGLRIRWYYFPWGAKQIPYSRIRSVSSISLTVFKGRARVWGSSLPLMAWANLDPRRPWKSTGLVLDLGKRIKVLLTPDDTAAVAAIIAEHREQEQQQ
jgi:hypothetical protein